ncbi:MAG TPA: DUF4390 domain-containing protein [Steroidobacteraceae bacterium]|nr:DUF4390 domain-containing protein [Steroidobacteraceae bacterium]
MKATAVKVPRGPRWRSWALPALLALAAAAPAEEPPTLDDGARFDVRSAFLEPAERVYQLNATLDLGLSKNAVQAIREGVPVLVELDLSVVRKRRYLPDVEIASLVQRWQIHYHALSERYLVNNLNSGQQTSYSSLGAALSALSDVRGLPVIDEALIERGQRYEASIRASAAIEGGLPSALKFILFWIDWKRTTDWYTWTVRL